MMIIGPYGKKFGQELFARIRALDLEDKVTVPGRIDNKEAMMYVSQATMGLSLLFPDPNYTICLASKILEYMMFGVPVLASDFDHWRKYVEGERTGIMVDPYDLDKVVEACQKMLSNKDDLEAMGKRGKVAVRDKYNWSSEFAVLLKCYSDLLGI
jgi:glycosyltransferase involved in cell wall biosynthesis